MFLTIGIKASILNGQTDTNLTTCQNNCQLPKIYRLHQYSFRQDPTTNDFIKVENVLHLFRGWKSFTIYKPCFPSQIENNFSLTRIFRRPNTNKFGKLFTPKQTQPYFLFFTIPTYLFLFFFVGKLHFKLYSLKDIIN